MKILIRVEAQAKKNEVIVLGGRCLKVRTTKPAKEGRANADIIAILAKHFGVSKSEVEILSGHRSKEKMIEICRI
jgi:hypothetical protein